MTRRSRYSPEVKERAVRMVFDQQAQHESQWSAISSIASKIDCTRETLRTWVRRAERDAGKRAGLTTDERQRLKELERESKWAGVKFNDGIEAINVDQAACAPQKVDPASIARFRSAMRGEYGGGGDWTHAGAGPNWSGTTGRSMSTSRLAMRSTSG